MQALIITAYKNFEQLRENLSVFGRDFNCYVHLDAGSELADSRYMKELNTLPNVTVISRYKILWGSYRHFTAILDLLQLALDKKENDYFHIISAEDFPVRRYSEFQSFFDGSKSCYLELTDISQMPSMQLRYQKFHFQHIFDRQSKNILIQLLDKAIRQIQYHLPFSRRVRFQYKGLVWCSIYREAAEHVLASIGRPELRILKYCEISEEFIFQNYLMQGSFKDTIVCDKLRFDIWDGVSIGSPRYLSIEDYTSIKASQAFFARKIRCGHSGNEDLLYRKLKDEYLGVEMTE